MRGCFGWTQTNLRTNAQENSIDVECKRIQKRRNKVRFNELHLASRLFSAIPPLEVVKVLVSIMMSVSLSNKEKPLKLRHYDISRAYFQGTAQRLIYIKLPVDVQRGAVHRTAPGVRRWSGSLVKAQASARLDVPTAPHHFSTVRTQEVPTRVYIFLEKAWMCTRRTTDGGLESQRHEKVNAWICAPTNNPT